MSAWQQGPLASRYIRGRTPDTSPRAMSMTSPVVSPDAERSVEFNIEGDPRPDLLELVHDVKPDQCTLVPVRPGEITSQAGWAADTPRERPWPGRRRATCRGCPRECVRRTVRGTASVGGRSWR